MPPKHSRKATTTINADSFKVTKSQLSGLMKLRGEEAYASLHDDFNGVLGLCESLLTSPTTGLTENEADLEERRKLFGRNVIPPKRAKTIFELAWEALQDLTLIILIVASVVSIGLSFYKPDKKTGEPEAKGESGKWVDGVAIMVAVVVVVGVAAVNDWRKDRQFRGLQSKIESEQKISTLRHSTVDQVLTKELVVGDICHIKYGDVLPADGVLIQGSDLLTDESSLTGESDLIKKNEKNPLMLSGTRVMEGGGHMVVTAVGENSQAGIIFVLLSDKESKESVNEKKEKGEGQEDGKEVLKQKSVLQAKLTRLTVQIGILGIVIALLTLVVLVLRFCIETYVRDGIKWSNTHIQNFIQFIITAVTILVVAIPEGLPLAVTIALAYSVVKMMKDNNLVRHLDACETMGSATAICSDKTGTLTTNRMTTVQAYVCGQFFAKVDECSQLPPDPRLLLSEAIAYNSGYTSKILPSEVAGGLPHQIGNKTECALLGFVSALGHDYEHLREKIPEQRFTKVYTFNSVRKSMSTVIPLQDEVGPGFRVFSKGASEIILTKCQFLMGDKGELHNFATKEREMIARTVIEPMASNGLRTISVAYRDFRPQPIAPPKGKSPEKSVTVEFYEGSAPDWEDETWIVSNLTCLGIMGIEDPVRPEVPEAIRTCQRSGITVRMVTGDNIVTARTIAYKCGIMSPGDDYLVIDGKEFNRRIRDDGPDGPVNQEKFDQVWPNLRVLARSSPEDKYVLVKGMITSTLNNSREVVAVTGDGTNDGPALKVADVGFAMGITGTDVAKEACDIILMDDNFTSIVKAVLWGRNVYDSISKFIQFQLTVNIVAVTIAFIGACAIGKSPLGATQMLWINLVMDALASLALATERPTMDLLERKPYGRDQYIISATMLFNIIMHAIYQLVVLFVILFAGASESLFDIERGFEWSTSKKDEYPKKQHVSEVHFTLVFNTLVMMTLFNELNCRQIRRVRNVFRGLHTNRIFIVIWIGSFIVQVIIVQFAKEVFHVNALTIDEWGWCLFLGMGELIWHQIILCIPIDRMRKVKITPDKTLSKMEKEQEEEEKERIEEELRKSKVLWVRGTKRLSQQIDVVRTFHPDIVHHHSVHRDTLNSHMSITAGVGDVSRKQSKERVIQVMDGAQSAS